MSPELREDIHEDLGVSLVACSLKGWRKTQEDTSAIVINLGGRKDMLGVGVFDGHSGQEASKYVAENMWNQVIATTEWGHGDIDGALKAAFLAVDANMQRDKVCHGTTAVVAVVTPGNLYVANCGDSRAVLCKEGVATAMSTDHKPCVHTERSRVIRCGGQVIPGEFGGVARVTAPGSMVAMATSRSLGDFHFKRNYNADQSEQVVSPAAEVVCVRRALGDEFLILGTDGVWDVLSNQEVGDMMRASNRTRIPRVPAPPPPPSVVWENSSSQASAAAAAAAAAAAENSRRDAADGGGRAGKASREPRAPQSLGTTMSQKAAGVPTDTPAGATNGFLPAAVPTTPYHPPVTPHNLQQTTPFGARAAASASAAAAAGAGADPYDSSDCGSSDAGDDAVDPSQLLRPRRTLPMGQQDQPRLQLRKRQQQKKGSRAGGKSPPEKGRDGTVGEGLNPKQGVAGDKDKDKVGGVPDGGGGGSWSTTPPPRPPVSLPRRGSGEGASTVATKPTANGHHDDDDHGGTTSRARTPGTGASSVVTPNPSGGRTSGSSDGGGITPSARTPGASSGGGGGGVSTAGTTPASARTPGGGAFSIGGSSSGGGGGTWTSGGVGQTPSRRPSTSRGATPSRVNSYRRSNGSGINLGLFKGSSSLSVSLSGQGDRSAIGAVQGVLDQALLKGSQDNMTLIAVDLRGFLEASSPISDSAMS
ncbi:protein phosphatase 2C-like [Ectocarpus siliculosus]|uniref:Protein phosphatase 2C-like n=1 Tax=Ectocarpus siliculosus TaxID=2880 RepID=D7G0F1_ECTSI|nr:protein phosphatase 2C-like [Ectocarpus siliculosus]|eukprot:CBJ26678.1 protein phosphatase 2C-like [Ectocarpus siliculosus]